MGDALRLTRILHPCVLLEAAGARVLFDPCFGFFAARARTRAFAGVLLPPPGLGPEEIGRLDLIAITHGHEDHFDRAGIERIPGRTARVAVPAASLARRVRRLGFRDVHVVAPWESLPGDGWRLTAVPARAPNAWREVSWVLSGPFGSILHAGDTAAHAHWEAIRDRCAPSAGCLPVNGVSLLGRRLTMNPEEAAAAAAALRLRVAIPIHAEMTFGRAAAIVYRTPGTEDSFREAAGRLSPATRILAAPRGVAIEIGPGLAGGACRAPSGAIP